MSIGCTLIFFALPGFVQIDLATVGQCKPPFCAVLHRTVALAMQIEQGVTPSGMVVSWESTQLESGATIKEVG